MADFIYGEKEIEHLKRRDKKMAAAIERIGMIAREVTPDLFEALISSIVGQQISSKAADTVWDRLVTKLGSVDANSILRCPADELQSCGLSFRKVEYIRGIAGSVLSGELDLCGLNDLPDKQVVETLSAQKGVGVWTAQMLMIFSMQRPDIVSWGDLAIRRGMFMLYGHKELTKEQFAKHCKKYSPFGSVASLYLWAVSAGQ